MSRSSRSIPALLALLAFPVLALRAQEPRPNPDTLPRLRVVHSYEWRGSHPVVCIGSTDLELASKHYGERFMSVCANVRPIAFRLGDGRYFIFGPDFLKFRLGFDLGIMAGKEFDIFARPYAEVAVTTVNIKRGASRPVRVELGAQYFYYYGLLWNKSPGIALIWAISF